MQFEERFSNTVLDEGKFKDNLKAGYGKVKDAAKAGYGKVKSGVSAAGKAIKAHPRKAAAIGAAGLAAAGLAGYGIHKARKNRTNEELIESLQYYNELSLKTKAAAKLARFGRNTKAGLNKVKDSVGGAVKNTWNGVKNTGNAIKAHPYRTAAAVGGVGLAGAGAYAGKKAYDKYKQNH